MTALNLEHILPLQEELDNHPVYGDLHSLADLRVFMSQHIFSVWDFMSLVKYLQNRIAPIQVPWSPRGDPALRYFINQLVLEEESDQVPGPDGKMIYGSHFELYMNAMAEIGADTQLPQRFLETVQNTGARDALESALVPEPARRFSETTFCLIDEDKPHMVAAALALGREHVIPGMFRRFLENMEIGEDLAPGFHYYLKRHIDLDQGIHGPLSMQMLETLCDGDALALQEAEAAAEEAICARIRFWDGVHEAIKAGNT
jgi:hypothetical protein